MTYTQTYADAKGETHFEDVTVDMTDAMHAKLSEMVAAKGAIFRLTKDYFVDWHPAPHRQFVVNSKGHTSRGIGTARAGQTPAGRKVGHHPSRSVSHAARPGAADFQRTRHVPR